MRTIFITAVVDEFEKVDEAVNKFLATRFKKDSQPVLFIFNIGPDKVEDNTHLWAALIHEPRLLVLKDAEPLPEIVAEYDIKDGKPDFASRREVAVPGQPYGKDYQRAFADAGKVAEKIIESCNLSVAFDDFRFYNFFNKPKYVGIKAKELEAIKSFKD